MILVCPMTRPGHLRKPRASGDDPIKGEFLHHTVNVNPARAGMILTALNLSGP